MNYKQEEIKKHILDNIDYFEGSRAEDLHHNLFNQDYYLIGYYQCSKWLGNAENLLDVLNYVHEWEEFNLGEVQTKTDINSEKLVNLYVYCVGDEIFNNIGHNFEGELTKKDIEKIKFNIEFMELFNEFDSKFYNIRKNIRSRAEIEKQRFLLTAETIVDDLYKNIEKSF